MTFSCRDLLIVSHLHASSFCQGKLSRQPSLYQSDNWIRKLASSVPIGYSDWGRGLLCIWWTPKRNNDWLLVRPAEQMLTHTPVRCTSVRRREMKMSSIEHYGDHPKRLCVLSRPVGAFCTRGPNDHSEQLYAQRNCPGINSDTVSR